MNHARLLHRIVLQFNGKKNVKKTILKNLSAAAFTPDGSLWLGTDEFTHLERLTEERPHHYSQHQRFNLADMLCLPEGSEQEIDIEGLSYSAPYLWVVGSHSAKRKQPKDTDVSPKRLRRIVREPNRYLLARIPLDWSKPTNPIPVKELGALKAAALPISEESENGSNVLMQELRKDKYLKDFAIADIPSKENGIDIEGLAVRGDRVFLGLRGPVLRGWAVMLELCIDTSSTDSLSLEPIGSKGCVYKRHFLDLNGLGIRELCLRGDDLIVLAGPTMTAMGGMQIFRLKGALELESDRLLRQSKHLELLFHMPFHPEADNAEGIALFSHDKQDDSIFVVYDSPSKSRQLSKSKVYADIFCLKSKK